MRAGYHVVVWIELKLWEEIMATHRFGYVLLIGTLLFVLELFGGWVARSVALYADAIHVLQDNAFILLAYLIERGVHGKSEADKQRAYKRGAWLQLLGLLAVAIGIICGGIQRFTHPEATLGWPMLIFAVIGALGNNFQHRLLHGINTLNAEALRYHIHSDYIQSIGVIVAAVIIMITGAIWVDALITVMIGLWMFWQCQKLLLDILTHDTHKHHCGCDHDHHGHEH